MKHVGFYFFWILFVSCLLSPKVMLNCFGEHPSEGESLSMNFRHSLDTLATLTSVVLDNISFSETLLNPRLPCLPPPAFLKSDSKLVSNQTSYEFKAMHSIKKSVLSSSPPKLTLIQKLVHKSFLISQHMFHYVLSSLASFFSSFQMKRKAFTFPCLFHQCHPQDKHFLIKYLHPYLPTSFQLHPFFQYLFKFKPTVTGTVSCKKIQFEYLQAQSGYKYIFECIELRS
ncbi:hypothetical protein HMI54_008240 [Coelomomyces lativittatus]|nr:hypothetical protein HMI54_008240 [Coelomomyces lativittatus]